MSRIVTLQHPRFTNLYASEVQWEDRGESGNTTDLYGGFTHTLINVTFKTPEFPPTGDNAFLEFRGRCAPRMGRVPAEAVTIGGVPSVFDTDQLIGGSDFEIVLHQLPSFDYPYYLARQNRTNSAAWTFMGVTYPAESLLFLGPSWHMKRQVGGVEQWEVGLGFQATTSDFLWNRNRDATGAIGLELVAGQRKYPLLNFNELIYH